MEQLITKKLFITDFDGVICDSVIECLLVTYNAYGRLQSSSFQRLLDIDRIDAAKREQFRQLRPYLKGAEDFIPLYLTMEQNVLIQCQKDFDTFRESRKALLTEYVNLFYAERDFLKTHEKELWLSLNPLFEDFAGELQQRNSFEGIHILTTKRQDDVLAIFEYQGITFPADQVTYMKAAGKPQKLQDMLQAHQAAYEQSVYIEDQVDFLIASQQYNIGSYLVEWGYVSDEQKTLAQQHGIPIINTRQFKDMLQNF